VEIPFERKAQASDFNGCPHIFDHARLRHGNANTARMAMPTWHDVGLEPELKMSIKNRKLKPEV
jgi:hypothetical protein